MRSPDRRGPTCIAIAHLEIRAPLRREDLPGLYARTCALLRGGPHALVCEVGGVAPDAIAGEALARLRLAALRNDVPLRFTGATPELVGVLDLMGLRAAVAPRSVSKNDLAGGGPARSGSGR